MDIFQYLILLNSKMLYDFLCKKKIINSEKIYITNKDVHVLMFFITLNLIQKLEMFSNYAYVFCYQLKFSFILKTILHGILLQIKNCLKYHFNILFSWNFFLEEINKWNEFPKFSNKRIIYFYNFKTFKRTKLLQKFKKN